MLYAHLFSFPSIRHPFLSYFFFFNDTATTEIYTLSLHDALPIWPGARADRDYEAVALQRLRREPNHPQVLFELAVQVDRAAPRRQHAHGEVCRLGEHPGVPVGNGAHIEAGHPAEPVERGVVDARLVFERGDQVPPVAPPREPRDLTRGAVRRDHKGRRHRTGVGVEPDVTWLERHAGHGTRRAERRPAGRGGRRP